VQFSPENPLQFWATDGTPGIERRPLFNTRTQPATSPSGPTISEEDTIRLGGSGNRYWPFRRMEGNPHGTAHLKEVRSFG
jgi:tyrosinase